MTLRNLIAAACVAVACAAPVVVRAAEPVALFPSKPIRWVVPFAAGGATDVIARMVAQKMTENWGQPVIIDNKPGGTGIVGSEAVKQAAPDGYTILMATASTHSVSPAVRPRLPYGLSDFTPVSLVATFPNMLVVHPSVAARTVPEFVALLKGNPGKYNFSSTGTGGSVHLAAELFQQMTGTKMVHIPYKGSAPALNDLLSGQVQCAFDNMTAVWPLVQSGSLRALGVASTQRVKAAPDVPAIAEFVPGFEATTWVGVLAPAGTSADIADKYAAEVKRIVSAPEVAKRLEDLGAASAANRPPEFASFIKADIEKWRRVVTAAGISVED
jgi:tripartite-type tricarboxylate transporter receptor subunit TctC